MCALESLQEALLRALRACEDVTARAVQRVCVVSAAEDEAVRTVDSLRLLIASDSDSQDVDSKYVRAVPGQFSTTFTRCLTHTHVCKVAAVLFTLAQHCYFCTGSEKQCQCQCGCRWDPLP